MKKLHKIIFIAFILTNSFNLIGLKAQRPMAEIHSMLIFNFIKYIDWPAETKSGDFVIAVYGDDEVYEQLNKFYGQRPIKGQSAKIINVNELSAINSAHVIYLASKKSSDFDALFEKFDTSPTLIVSDRSGLGKKGSSINFKEIGGKLKFEINQATIEDSNLKISSQLLNMGIVL